MCLYIVDNVSTCCIIYFRYVNTEKRINNGPTKYGVAIMVQNIKSTQNISK